MFAAAPEGSADVTVWLRRRNVPAQGKPWDIYGGSGGPANGSSEGVMVAGDSEGDARGGAGAWNFQPATVLNNDGPLVQVVWGRGPGAQQDYLLTLGEDGRCAVVFRVGCFEGENWERGMFRGIASWSFLVREGLDSSWLLWFTIIDDFLARWYCLQEWSRSFTFSIAVKDDRHGAS